jgi:hypothetical protein
MNGRTDVRVDKWTNERRGRKGWEEERTDGRSVDGKTEDERKDERRNEPINGQVGFCI